MTPVSQQSRASFRVGVFLSSSLTMLFWSGAGPTAGQAGAQEPLCYRGTPGQAWQYLVSIEVEQPEVVETWEGLLTYKVQKVGPNGIEFSCADQLSHSARWSKPGPPIPPPPFFGKRVPLPLGTREEVTIVVSPTGRLVQGKSVEPLPYLLGYKQMVVFEPLPQQERTDWVEEQKIDVVVTADLGPVFGPFFVGQATRELTRLAATERSEYQIQPAGPEGVVIEKKTSLVTDQKVADRPQFELTGGGSFTFDKSQGKIRELDFRYELVKNEELRSVRHRMKVSAKLLTPEEVAEWQKKHEERLAAAKARAAELQKPIPLGAGEKEQLLEELRSGDTSRQRKALQRLARAERQEPADPVCQAILPLIQANDVFIRQQALRALRVWATPAAEAQLLQAAGDPNPLVAGEAMLALSRIPSPQVIGFLASKLGWPPQAAEALKTIGPAAEEAVLGELERLPAQRRAFALDVLASIGGEKSLAVLKNLAAGAPDRPAIEKTIQAIEARIGKQ